MSGTPLPAARRPVPREPASRRWRSWAAVVARRATSGEAVRLRQRILRSLVLTLAAAVLAAPFAAVWGGGHARVEDYLGPHRVTFASTYRHEVEVNLGPLGKAYLPSPAAPLGLRIDVGGVGTAATGDSLLSPETLASYAGLYTEPREAVAGVVDRLRVDAAMEALKAELVLLTGFALWLIRRRLLTPGLVRHISARRLVLAYGVVLLVIASSVLAPHPPAQERRIRVAVAEGTSFAGLTTDSVLLADLLDRGITGVRLLAGRQARAVAQYVARTAASLNSQAGVLPAPRSGETMLLGYSDLHCNRATTRLLARLVRATEPALVISSGDDTVNGTAAERGCVTREAGLAAGRPHLVATGNHDTDVTESQLRAAGVTVLDGAPVEAAGLTVLGDDDPEQNIPFSVERIRTREETEPELGERMVQTARRTAAGVANRPPGVDVLALHQPAATAPVLRSDDPPARLVLWGHYHAQVGPTVVSHADGSWTVGMQQGTAGGVREPTITSFSTPFSPPLIRADAYFYFRHDATGLITGVQPVHFTPAGRFVVDPRIATGDLEALPAETRAALGGAPAPSPRR